MYVPKPPKPKFSRGMIYYLLITIGIIFFFIVFIANVDWETRLDGLGEIIVMIDGVPLVLYLAYFGRKCYDYRLANTNYDEYKRRVEAKADAHAQVILKEQAEIRKEEEEAIASQYATEPWAKRYMTSPCPYCGHYKVRYAKWEDKSLSVAFWGIASSAIGKNYKCEHCNRMWE